MAKKNVTFVATRFKNKKTRVSFYTESGKQLASESVKRVPRKEKISFTTNVK